MNMEFSIKQKYLLQALNMLSGVVEKSDPSKDNHFSNILFNLNKKYLVLITNNKEVELKIKLKNLFIKQIGCCSVNFNKLYSICKNFDKNDFILFNLKESLINIVSLNSKYTLSSYNSSNFPLYNTEKAPFSFKINRIILKNILNKISFSMGIQDVRFFLNGMLLDFTEDKLIWISTDGYRLSKADLPIDLKNLNDRKIIIPRQSVIELYKIISSCVEQNINFNLSYTFLKINVGALNYRTKLLSGNYPNYNDFIPKGNNKFLIVNSAILKKIFLRISVLCNIKSNKILITCENNKLIVRTLNFYKDQGIEEMFINYLGTKIDIGFNIKYITDILSKLDSDIVEISIFDANSSVIFREVENNKSYSVLYVLMPVRI